LKISLKHKDPCPIVKNDNSNLNIAQSSCDTEAKVQNVKETSHLLKEKLLMDKTLNDFLLRKKGSWILLYDG
jgi:hypothetical protein